MLSCSSTALAALPDWLFAGVAATSGSLTKLRMPDKLTSGRNTSTTSFWAAASCAGVSAASAVSEKPSNTRLAGTPPAIARLKSVRRVTLNWPPVADRRSTAAYRLPSVVLMRTRHGPCALAGKFTVNWPSADVLPFARLPLAQRTSTPALTIALPSEADPASTTLTGAVVPGFCGAPVEPPPPPPQADNNAALSTHESLKRPGEVSITRSTRG